MSASREHGRGVSDGSRLPQEHREELEELSDRPGLLQELLHDEKDGPRRMLQRLNEDEPDGIPDPFRKAFD